MDRKIVVILAAAATLLYVPSYAADYGQGAGTSDFVPVIISIFSFLVAAGTFFLTQLRPARITSYVGPDATLGHPPVGGLAMTVPITFTNHGASTGAVLRAGLTLWRKDSPNDRFFMRWDSFVKLNFSTNKWDYEEAAHTLAVPGKSIVVRIVNFVWLPTNAQQIVFREGTYCVCFHYWTNEKERQKETHDLDITGAMAQSLNLSTSATPQAVLVTFDETIKKNIHLNESEFKKLI